MLFVTFKGVIQRTSIVGELVHSDLYDFHGTFSLGNKNHVVSFIDDYSNFAMCSCCFLMNEALYKFKVIRPR